MILPLVELVKIYNKFEEDDCKEIQFPGILSANISFEKAASYFNTEIESDGLKGNFIKMVFKIRL